MKLLEERKKCFMDNLILQTECLPLRPSKHLQSIINKPKPPYYINKDNNMPNVTLNKVSNKKIFSRLTNTYNIIERKHHKKSKSAFAYPMSLLPELNNISYGKLLDEHNNNSKTYITLNDKFRAFRNSNVKNCYNLLEQWEQFEQCSSRAHSETARYRMKELETIKHSIVEEVDEDNLEKQRNNEVKFIYKINKCRQSTRGENNDKRQKENEESYWKEYTEQLESTLVRRPLEECVRKGRIRRGSRRVRIVDLVDELKPWNVGDGEEHDVGEVLV